MSRYRTRLVVFRQLVALMKLGLPAKDALFRINRALPRSRLTSELHRVSKALTKGGDPAQELASIAPKELQGVLREGGDGSLPERLELLTKHLARIHKMEVHLSSIRKYPLITSALALLSGALLAAMCLQLREDVGWSLLPRLNLMMVGSVLGTTAVLVLVMFGSAFKALRAGRLASWARLLPGGAYEDQLDQARFLFTMALRLDPRFGNPSIMGAVEGSALALRRRELHSRVERLKESLSGEDDVGRMLRGIGLDDEDLLRLGLGHRAGRLGPAAEQVAEGLQKQALAASERFVGSLGLLFLALAAAIIALVLFAFVQTVVGG